MIPGVSYAKEVMPAIHFSLKPRLCVLTDGEENCHDQLEVQWMSETPRSVCLYQNDQPMPLQCWSNQNTGEYRFVLTTNASTDFQLREDEHGRALGQEMFEVVHQQKRYRKPRRNPWNFF